MEARRKKDCKIFVEPALVAYLRFATSPYRLLCAKQVGELLGLSGCLLLQGMVRSHLSICSVALSLFTAIKCDLNGC